MQGWLAGLLAGYGIAVPLGAVAVLIVSLASRTSFRIGAAAGAGAATADLTYAAVAVTSGYGLSALLAPFTSTLQLGGATVLAALGLRGLHAAWRAGVRSGATREAGDARVVRTYLGFLGLTLLNPLTVLYFAALILGRQATVTTPGSAIAFVVGVFVASLSWQLLLAGLGAVLHRSSFAASRFWTAVLGNALVIGFAVHIAATTG
jgi:arginine exporter protein ArgO